MPENTLMTESGGCVIVTSVEADETVNAENTVTVYNFTVEGWHTYYVGEWCVLVHNACSKADVLAANRKQRRDFETKQFEKIKGEYPNAVEQVTIVTADGTRIRMDAIALDAEGNVLLFEFKSSESAGFTNNQKSAYHDHGDKLKGGGEVRGKKPGKFQTGFKIPADTKVDVKRP